jgi:ADP-ribosyl-[dinitrogen reductase] hydrolase
MEEIPFGSAGTRALGAMLGQLAGDALGSMVEFAHPEDVRARYPQGLSAMGPSPCWKTIAGQPTDDSELAFELADALIAGGAAGYDPYAAAARYLRWGRSDPFDMGGTIGLAVMCMDDAERIGGDIVSAAYARPYEDRSQANGALMRHAVLGVWGWCLDPKRLADVVAADARLTHGHPVCQEASQVFVLALAETIREGLSARQAWDVALTWHRRYGAQSAVRDRLERAANEPPEKYGGWVLTSLHNAFYQALHAPTLEAGVVDTVMHGDDADTNGCIAGALMGAIHGAESIPPGWVETLLTCEPGPHTPRPRPERYWPRRAWEVVRALLEAGQTAARVD